MVRRRPGCDIYTAFFSSINTSLSIIHSVSEVIGNYRNWCFHDMFSHLALVNNSSLLFPHRLLYNVGLKIPCMVPEVRSMGSIKYTCSMIYYSFEVLKGTQNKTWYNILTQIYRNLQQASVVPFAGVLASKDTLRAFSRWR